MEFQRIHYNRNPNTNRHFLPFSTLEKFRTKMFWIAKSTSWSRYWELAKFLRDLYCHGLIFTWCRSARPRTQHPGSSIAANSVCKIFGSVANAMVCWQAFLERITCNGRYPPVMVLLCLFYENTQILSQLLRGAHVLAGTGRYCLRKYATYFWSTRYRV